MGRFSCYRCSGEFYIPLRTSFICPNCNLDLKDETVVKSPAELAREEEVKAKRARRAKGAKVTTKKLKAKRKTARKSAKKKVGRK